jgi:hypothetical protein
MTRTPRPRKTLSDSFHRQLNMYSLAASAAGVGTLALAQPAQARIVYTPAHDQLVFNDPYLLDFDNNVDADFFLLPVTFVTSASRFRDLEVCHRPTSFSRHWVCRYSTNVSNRLNQVVATKAQGPAAALRAGAKIQEDDQFAGTYKGGGVGVSVAEAVYTTVMKRSRWVGPWLNGGKGVTDRYLGLKFKINGQFHFGWVRLTIRTRKGGQFTATLTGYAYETIPGKAIIAGATKDADDVESTASLSTRTAEPATLGMLALGAPGLSIWRREEWSDLN